MLLLEKEGDSWEKKGKIVNESVPEYCGFVLGTVGVFHLSCVLCLVFLR